MSGRDLLIVAVTRMKSGLCMAGYWPEPHPRSGLRWVRPVRPYDTLLVGDLTDDAGRVVEPWDVVDLPWAGARPQPPHVEDCEVDWMRRRPRVLRRLVGERRSRFLERYLDRRPQDVLGKRPTRSLCLVRPESVEALFRKEPGAGRFEARLAFSLDGLSVPAAELPPGVPVTDLRWRALGRAWLGKGCRELKLAHRDVMERLGAQDLYLALGLSRAYAGRHTLLVIGVHPVPECVVEVDYADP